MLTIDVTHLKGKKNLLAFSAGVDSSALFFILLAQNIKFDIAIVDYGIRKQSKEEVLHAQTLAKKYKLFCHSIKAPAFDTHFEKQARDFRYEFFESLIRIEGYDTLLTAHQLNDQLEWLLMRLTKGAGLCELLGLDPLYVANEGIFISIVSPKIADAALDVMLQIPECKGASIIG